MPHLMLKFNADREVQEIAGQLVPTGNETIEFKMIDTDKGKVVELQADAKNIKHSEREPTPGEMSIATRTLGKEPGAGAHKEQIERLERELAKARQDLNSAKADNVAKNKLILSLNSDVAELQKKVIAPEHEAFLAAALDGHIADLAAKGQYESYESAKKLFHQLTGISYVDEGDEDDDEEEDLDRQRSLNRLLLDFAKKYPVQEFHSEIKWSENAHSDPIADIMKFMNDVMRPGPIRPSRLVHYGNGIYFEVQDHDDLLLEFFPRYGRRSGKTLAAWRIADRFGFLSAEAEFFNVRPNIERFFRRLNKKSRRKGLRIKDPIQKRGGVQTQQWRKQEKMMRKQRLPGR